MTDRELIQRFQEGDVRSFDELAKRHYPRTYEFFSHIVPDLMEADDLCQETYIRVYRGLKKFRGESEFTTWLYRISVNVANSHFRKRRIMEVFSADEHVTEASSDDPQNQPHVDRTLWRAIGRLPRKQKTVLLLRVFQELSFKEVAGVLAISENSAKVNYHHAINRLKSLAGED
ncbi:MAG: RNA polymerase sigma factor [Candidatus Neomarinimicrobiota bacterium]